MARWFAMACFLQAPQAQPPPELPNGNGRALVLRVCTKCHGVEMFSGIRMTRDEWKFEVDGMITRGAKANRQDARRIVDYLAKKLAPAARK